MFEDDGKYPPERTLQDVPAVHPICFLNIVQSSGRTSSPPKTQSVVLFFIVGQLYLSMLKVSGS